MARALWKGAISFGLVNIPVELYPAEDRKSFKFSMLDKRDLSPVGYKRYSKKTKKEVEWSNIVKGYEYEKDQYVVLSDEDFRRANVKATQTIDIQAFVPADEIPVEYFESPYYLAPAARGQKVYAPKPDGRFLERSNPVAHCRGRMLKNQTDSQRVRDQRSVAVPGRGWAFSSHRLAV